MIESAILWIRINGRYNVFLHDLADYIGSGSDGNQSFLVIFEFHANNRNTVSGSHDVATTYEIFPKAWPKVVNA